MKIYLAAPIFSAEELALIETILEAIERRVDAEVFSPYHASREIWRGRKPADCTEEERQQVLHGNIDHLRWADVVLAVLQRMSGGYESRTDTGVTWELGYAHAVGAMRNGSNGGRRAGARPLLVGYIHPYWPLPRGGVNLMLAGTLDAVARDLYQMQNILLLAKQGHISELHNDYHPSRGLPQEKDPIR